MLSVDKTAPYVDFKRSGSVVSHMNAGFVTTSQTSVIINSQCHTSGVIPVRPTGRRGYNYSGMVEQLLGRGLPVMPGVTIGNYSSWRRTLH